MKIFTLVTSQRIVFPLFRLPLPSVYWSYSDGEIRLLHFPWDTEDLTCTRDSWRWRETRWSMGDGKMERLVGTNARNLFPIPWRRPRDFNSKLPAGIAWLSRSGQGIVAMLDERVPLPLSSVRARIPSLGWGSYCYADIKKSRRHIRARCLTFWIFI